MRTAMRLESGRVQSMRRLVTAWRWLGPTTQRRKTGTWMDAQGSNAGSALGHDRETGSI